MFIYACRRMVERKQQPPFPLFTRFPSPFERASYKFYNYLDNSLYPVRPVVFGASVAAFAAYYTKWNDSGLLSYIPHFGEGAIAEYSRVGAASLVSAYAPVLVLRSFLRHFYFKYKRFLFESPKKVSTLTTFWGVVRSLLNLVPPRLKSCDVLLPSPPVPQLEHTIQRYLESIEHLHSKETLLEIEEMAKSFLKGEGKKLQRYAWLYSMCVDNYVTGFWEKFAYLYNRECLLISSSVAHIDLFVDSPATQATRAAHIIYIECLSHLAIDRQTYNPLGNGLVCARHYEKMYCVSRIPGESIDYLQQFGIRKHVAVLFNGGIYKLEYVDATGRIYSLLELTDILTELLTRENTKVEGPEGKIVALTHDKRTDWARNRKRFFEEIPKNKKALEVIESAVFVLILEDNEDWGYDPSNPDMVSKFIKDMLTGSGSNRWVDKSLNYIVGKNGRCGGTTEHSIADGSEFDHIMENFAVLDTLFLEYPPLEDQLKRERKFKRDEGPKNGLRFAEKLDIEVPEEMASEIIRCESSFANLRDDVDLASLIFRDWGKGRIKECGVSPDAFMQMAIQLANYRDQGRFVLTYEPASARFYKDSRTETLRSVTTESCDFVKSMLNPNVDNETRIAHLKKATELHTLHNKECMVNKGVDRHLFVLYIFSQAVGVSSPFLDHYIQQDWLLSTSHVPNVTNTMAEDKKVNFSWMGACFGAVAKNGYGVCYRFAGNHSICCHITSYHSAENTDSSRFRQHLVDAMDELSSLFK